MKRQKLSVSLLLLALAGLVLVGAGAWHTVRTEPLLQYAVPAPADADTVKELVLAKAEALADMSDAVDCAAVLACKGGTAVSAKEGSASATAELIAGGEGMFAVSPRFLTEGRLLSETELKTGTACAVLDEDLAFLLFPTTGAVGQTVLVEGAELEVVGVVRHNRHVGERELYSLYAPILALPEAGYDTMTLAVRPVESSGAETMFQAIAPSYWTEGGTVWSLQKETMRAHMPLRVSATLYAIGAIFWLLRLWNRFASERFQRVRSLASQQYFAKVAPRAIGNGLLLALGYAALAAGLYAVCVFTVQPLYVFPEWVPDNLVMWSSIRTVFWNLAVSDAALVQVGTQEVLAIRFWAGVIRWGVFFLYAAGLLAALRRLLHSRD